MNFLKSLSTFKYFDLSRKIRKSSSFLLLNIVQKLHEGNTSLYYTYFRHYYSEKMIYPVLTPVVNFFIEHPVCVNWYKTKNGMNILHFLAYGCNNILLKKILESLTRNNPMLLGSLLNISVKREGFQREIHTTPLHNAKNLFFDKDRETVALFSEAKRKLGDIYFYYKKRKTYERNHLLLGVAL
jgi:hypothetical protein